MNGQPRERRWLVLAEDGRVGGWLGRATDPSDDEIAMAERGLVAAGTAGWLAVSEGVYYSSDVMTLMCVRPLGSPAGGFDEAAARFHAARKAQLDGLDYR